MPSLVISQSQQQTQAKEDEIKRSVNFQYVEGTCEKLRRRILRNHKIRLTFYTENTLHKLLCKITDRSATEYKSNIVYEIDM